MHDLVKRGPLKLRVVAGRTKWPVADTFRRHHNRLPHELLGVYWCTHKGQRSRLVMSDRTAIHQSVGLNHATIACRIDVPVFIPLVVRGVATSPLRGNCKRCSTKIQPKVCNGWPRVVNSELSGFQLTTRRPPVDGACCADGRVEISGATRQSNRRAECSYHASSPYERSRSTLHAANGIGAAQTVDGQYRPRTI